MTRLRYQVQWLGNAPVVIDITSNTVVWPTKTVIWPPKGLIHTFTEVDKVCVKLNNVLQTKTIAYEPDTLTVKCGSLEVLNRRLWVDGVEPETMTKAVITIDWTVGPNAGITLELTQIVDPRITTHPNGVEAPSEPTE